MSKRVILAFLATAAALEGQPAHASDRSDPRRLQKDERGIVEMSLSQALNSARSIDIGYARSVPAERGVKVVCGILRRNGADVPFIGTLSTHEPGRIEFSLIEATGVEIYAKATRQTCAQQGIRLPRPR